MITLIPSEVAALQSILQQGINKMTYSIVSNYLVPRGYSWAAASGIARRLVPSFSPVDFAEQWYNPYQVVRQKLDAVTRGLDKLIPRKDIIEKPLKQATKYMYNVSFDYLDAEGDLIIGDSAAYYSNEELTPEEVALRAETVFDEPSESVPYGSGNYKFVSILHNEGWTY